MQDPAQTQPPAPPARSGIGMPLVLALIAFLLGAGLAGWLAWRGTIDFRQVFGGEGAPRQERLVTATPAAQPPATAPAPAASAAPLPAQPEPVANANVAAVETRVALLEERMSRLTLQAEAASGNAARAEGLLIAFAARRAIDRGAQLGYLEDQLKLRFGDAQPNAVRTIIEASGSPVTLDQLFSQLQAAGAALARTPSDENAWTRIRREFADLFIIRKDSGPVTRAEDRVDRAKLMLASGNIDAAIAEVQRLPGAAIAQDWLVAARRYDAAHRALDLLETAAMLEPRKLQDGNGAKVEQPTPIQPVPVLPSPIPTSPIEPAAKPSAAAPTG